MKNTLINKAVTKKIGGYKKFLTDDYHVSNKEVLEIQHKCKMGFVSVLDGVKLSQNVGVDIWNILELRD